jgi:hypothetical protein
VGCSSNVGSSSSSSRRSRRVSLQLESTAHSRDCSTVGAGGNRLQQRNKQGAMLTMTVPK